MLLYIFVALFPMCAGYLYNLANGKKAAYGLMATENPKERRKILRTRWIWLAVAAFPMFLLIAIRGYHIGADTSVYWKFFDYVKYASFEQALLINSSGAEFEVGYVIFEKIVSLFTKNAYAYQVIYTRVYYIIIVSFANQLEKENFLFLYFFATLGIYTFMFTGVRQCLAMCICLCSYAAIKKRKLVLFVLCVAIAFFFHKSAILFAVAYFMYNRKISFANAFIYGIIGVFCYLNIETLQEWFDELLEYDYEIESTGNGFIYLALIIAITIFSLVVLKLYKNPSQEYQGAINIGIIALVFWILRLVTRVAERPSYYFLFFTMAMLAYALGSIKTKDKGVIVRYGVMVVAMLLYIYRFMTNFSFMVPYDTFF